MPTGYPPNYPYGFEYVLGRFIEDTTPYSQIAFVIIIVLILIVVMWNSNRKKKIGKA